MLFKEWLTISESAPGIRLEKVLDSLVTPTCVVHDGKDLYICDQIGKIYKVGEKKPFLDISSDLRKLKPKEEGKKKGLAADYDERGILGLAFRGNRCFVYHSAVLEEEDKQFNHDSVLTSYKIYNGRAVSPKEILRIPQEEYSHNGGDITFGPDGYLYIPTGDGGCCADNHGEIGNAQNLGSLKGKILRIDVSASSYKVPSDNPFVGKKGVRSEIWAYGFRNPWKISFDGKKLYVAQVGEGENNKGGWECIFEVKKGGNHGWRIREGTHYYDRSLMKKIGLTADDFVDPIHEYSHKIGRAIIGGYVYRGELIPELRGCYVFGDWSNSWEGKGGGKLFCLKRENGSWVRREFNYASGNKSLDYFVLAFGEGIDKELYVCMKKGLRMDKKEGVVFKIAVG